MKDLNAIFCVLSWIPSRITLSSIFEAARDENYRRHVAVLFQKNKNEEKMGGRTSEMCMHVRRK